MYVYLLCKEGRHKTQTQTESPFDIVIIHDVAEEVCVVRHS